MGKVKKEKLSQPGKVTLEQQIEGDKFVKPKNRSKIRKRKDEDEQYVDADLTKKILKVAQKQKQELQDEFPTLEESLKRKPVKLDDFYDESVESELEDGDDVDGCDLYEDLKIDEQNEKAMEMFMKKDPTARKTLGDIIAEKIVEKNNELEMEFSDAGSVGGRDIDPRVIKLYEGVKEVLRRYRRGKLPNPIKVLYLSPYFERLLYITDPPSWSAAAIYQVTRIFAGNLKAYKARIYYNLVLLPRIRDDLMEFKRLNFHLYQALKKSLYKPAAFMKGILLPLLESGTCTLREAIIVGSIVAKNKIPVDHSAAAIISIAKMSYTGASSIMLRILLDKKYKLPLCVVNEVVAHFLRFTRDSRELPVLWHQAFLTFVQRYKNNLTSDERDSLLQLLKKHTHPLITPEIRRELQNAKCLDDEQTEMSVD